MSQIVQLLVEIFMQSPIELIGFVLNDTDFLSKCSYSTVIANYQNSNV